MIRLAPQAAGVPEAVDLVVVVVCSGEILNAFVECRVGNPIPVLDARRAEADVVPCICLFDSSVMRDSESGLAGLVGQRAHDVAVYSDALDSVDAHSLELANARACGDGSERLGWSAE